MKVLRLENEDFGGPFRGRPYGFDTLYVGHCYDEFLYSHPAPWNDGLDFATIKGWAFGCDSMEQMRFWFCASVVNDHTQKYEPEQAQRYEDKDFANLDKFGYQVVEYYVPDDLCEYGESLRQLAFDRKIAVKTGVTYSIKELFMYS